MSDIQNLSSKTVKPLTLLNKTNEIIDTVNEQLNTSYTETNPALTSIEGVCTWVITHNLDTEEVSCTVYEGDDEVFAKVEITSENVVTVTINSSVNISKDIYSVLILAKGGLDNSSSSSITVDTELSSTSTNPIQNKVITTALNDRLNINASNLSSTGQKVFDGQWVASALQLMVNQDLTNTTYHELDFSSYLPNDGYIYEVNITWWLGATSPTEVGQENRINIGLSHIGASYAYLGSATASKISSTFSIYHNSLGTVTVVVGTSRKLKLIVYNNSKGHMSDLSAVGYRRIGTNN